MIAAFVCKRVTIGIKQHGSPGLQLKVVWANADFLAGETVRRVTTIGIE